MQWTDWPCAENINPYSRVPVKPSAVTLVVIYVFSLPSSTAQDETVLCPLFSLIQICELACSVIIYLTEGSTVTPPRGQGEHVTLREKKSVTKLSLP